MHILFFMSACISILAVFLICFFMFIKGCPAIGKIGVIEFLMGTSWKPQDSPASFGILPMIAGSVYVTAGAIIIGVPLGLLTAVFMAEFCPKRLYKFLMPPINLFGWDTFNSIRIFWNGRYCTVYKNCIRRNGKQHSYSVNTFLGIMILPMVVGMSESALKAVPKQYYEGALALGATHERAVCSVVVPAAKSGILASVILAVGRAVGETMAVIMIAGNQPRMPKSVLQGVRTLTANIVIEMSYATDLHYDALIATGVVLFVFILLLNVIFNVITTKRER